MTSLFFGTSGPHDADIVFVAEAWGSEEEKKHLPLVGSSGQDFDRILAECGIDRDDVFCTNLVAARPHNNELRRFFHKTKAARSEGKECIRGLYPKAIVRDGLEILRQQLEIVQPKIVIALGNYALWALTEDCFGLDSKGIPKDPEGTWKVPTGITLWRGSQLKTRDDMGGFLLLPTYHPAAVQRNWPWRSDMKHDIKQRALPGVEGKWEYPDYRFLLRPSFEAVMKTLDMLIMGTKVTPQLNLSVDLETRGGHIACIGLAWSARDAICIPLMCVENNDGYWSADEEFAIIMKLRELMLHPKVAIIGQNFVYDLQYFALFWCMLPKTSFDTMIAQHLCWPGKQKALYYISSMYCKFHRYWKDEGKTWDKNVPEEVLWNYNCIDAVATYEAARELKKLINHFGLEEQFIWQMESMELALDMMLKGVAIDTKLRPIMGLELMGKIQEYEDYFAAVIPWKKAGKGSPWWRSPKKQMSLFYEDLGCKRHYDNKTRQLTVDKEALDKIAEEEPLLRPIIQHMHEYRSAGVFMSTFILAKLDPDDQMRCSYDVTGTETFRWNSKKNAFDRGGNLQNIPEGDEDA